MPLVRVLGRPLVAVDGHEPCGRFALPLAVILLVLPLLAYVSPPDPLWISGLYDGADFNEVIDAVVSATEPVGLRLPMLVKPAVIGAGILPLDDPASAPAGLSPALLIRAPPLS